MFKVEQKSNDELNKAALISVLHWIMFVVSYSEKMDSAQKSTWSLSHTSKCVHNSFISIKVFAY